MNTIATCPICDRELVMTHLLDGGTWRYCPSATCPYSETTPGKTGAFRARLAIPTVPHILAYPISVN